VAARLLLSHYSSAARTKDGSSARLEKVWQIGVGKSMSQAKPFDEPQRIVLNRIYTRSGDQGQTSLVGGQRVFKDDLRIECYGTVDELNAFIGLARSSAEQASVQHEALREFASTLRRVQHELFNLGSILATLPEDVHPKQPSVTAVEIQKLEHEIDTANQHLPPLRSFVLPGASRLDAELHVCRTICRRAERLLVALSREAGVPLEAVQYLNRLSDALFVWSRWVNSVQACGETLWQPNAAASGEIASS
jgi:cob(I)alamin adenosyltransferase